MDTVDKVTRSRIMSKVGQRDTEPEMQIRRALHRLGFRYRLHGRDLPGTPDLALPQYRAVIFVHGCFWHAHGCQLSKIPQTRRDFWAEKFAANRARDKRKNEALRELGWRILVVWQCAVKGKSYKEFEVVIASVISWLRSSKQCSEIPFSST